MKEDFKKYWLVFYYMPIVKNRYLKASCSNHKSQTMYRCSISKNIRNRNHPFSSPSYKLYRLSPQVPTGPAPQVPTGLTPRSPQDWHRCLLCREAFSDHQGKVLSQSLSLLRYLQITANTCLHFLSSLTRELQGLDPYLSCSNNAPALGSSWHTRDA